jgi:hypothetical protein
MHALRSLLIGLGVGAGLSYFFDAKSGRRRRALVRDQIMHAMHNAADQGEAKMRDFRNRAKGAVAEIRGALKSGEQHRSRKGPPSIAESAHDVAGSYKY